jgi:hypothetical protein
MFVDRRQHRRADLALLQQMPELADVVSSGTASRPRSILTNSRISAESYSASSTAGSDRLNHCCKK